MEKANTEGKATGSSRGHLSERTRVAAKHRRGRKKWGQTLGSDP